MPKYTPVYFAGSGGQRRGFRRVLITLAIILAGIVAIVAGDPLASAAACPTPASDLGTATMTLNVPVTATYAIWTRMKAPSTTANAVNLQVDNGTCFSVGGGSLVAASWVAGSGNWVRYQDGTPSNVIAMTLSAGNHTFKYVGTEPDVEIDRIILSSDASCTPTGTGDNCQSGDSTNPTVSLTAPANGANATGPVTFQAVASDASGIDKIEFLVDGVVVNSTSGASSAQYSWSSAAVANGTHAVTARATDTKNNSTTTAPATIQVNNPIQCTGNPTVPANFRVSATGSNSVTLAWNASNPAAGCSLQDYRLYRNDVQIATSSGAVYTDGNLDPATVYSYTVAAADTAGHLSARSAVVNATTAADTTTPTQPTGLRTTLTTASAVALAWNASSDNSAVKDYVIYRNGSQVGVSTTTAYTDNALAPDTAYSFTVRARDAANNLSAASTALPVSTLAGTNANKGDLDNNGRVGLADLSILISHWNRSGVPVSQGDINGSGKVDLTDLSILLSNWGKNL